MAFPNLLWASSNTTCWFVLRWSTAKDANSCKWNQPCHGHWYYLQHFCRVVLLPCWFIRSIKLKVFRVKKLLSPCCVVSMRSGQKSLDFSTIGKKKEEHFLLLRRRGKFRYRRLSGEEIFPDRQKYFQVFTTVSWYFTALAKVGDRTFTITAAAKTVGNWVKNKSQIQRRDEILRKCKIIV